MVKFKFFVQCSGWKDGGYANTHFAENEKEAEQIVNKWNAERDEIAKRTGKPVDGYVKLLEVTAITEQQFAEDYIYA